MSGFGDFPVPAKKEPETLAYLVTLKSGAQLLRFAEQEPPAITKAIAQARKNNTEVAWADGDCTVGQEIADCMVVDLDDDGRPIIPGASPVPRGDDEAQAQ